MSNNVIDGKAELVDAAPSLPDLKMARQLSSAYKDAVTGVRRVIIFGLLALEAKARCKHGEFGPYLERHCPGICWRTGQRMMASAEGVLAVLETKHNVLFGKKSLSTVLSLSDAKSKKLSTEALAMRNKVFELIDGKSQRQLLLEFRSEAKERKYNPPRLTDDEKTKAEIRDAELGIGHLIGDIHTFCLEGRALGLVKDSTRNNLMEAGIAMNNRLREFASKKSKSKKS